MSYFSLSKEIKNKTFSLFSPFSNFFKKIAEKLNNIIFNLKEKKVLKEENDKLKAERNKLLVEIRELHDLKEENEQLKKALNLELGKEFNFSLAKVIQIDLLKEEIVINKGKKDGVSIGDTVLLGDKTLIGKVKEVFENYSIVSLAFKKNFIFSVKVGLEGEIYGIAEGLGEGKILIKELPKTNVKEKEYVFTSSFGGIFPPNLLVGEIENIESKDIDPFQKAIVRVLYNFRELNTVFIIK